MTKTRWFILGGLLFALLLGGVVSYYASSQPDGLNKVAEDKGFAAQESEHATADSPLAGYATEGVSDERLSGGLAVGAGVLICFAIGGALFWGVSRRAGRGAPSESVSAAQE
jgi:cobalt/nickel transport system permease protein/cobalt/nickel transport protein